VELEEKLNRTNECDQMDVLFFCEKKSEKCRAQRTAGTVTSDSGMQTQTV